jgi:GNAT superfamily N-acetyltransferase
LTNKFAASVSIELAQDEQLARIPAIELGAATMFPAEDLPDHIRYRVTDARTLQEAKDESRLWVAINGNAKVVGFALVDVVDEFAHLDELNVLPDYGCRGIGTKLVQTACRWARRKGFPGLSLVTFRHLPWNAPFYEKLGFVELNQVELGAGLAGLLEEEAKAGMEIHKRIGMILRFEDQHGIQVHT